MNLVVHEEAKLEWRAAVIEYHNERPELGQQLSLEIDRLVSEIREHPLLFRQFDPPARRHFSRRFPFGVIYLVLPDSLWIVAVMHMSREPGYWKRRIE